MGSTWTLRIRIYQKFSQPFFHHGESLSKSSQPPVSARRLCTRDFDHSPGVRQINRKNNVSSTTSGSREEGLWGDLMKGSDKCSTPRLRPSFAKSVFAAGTAKRTARMLQRKPGLVSQDPEPERSAGRVQPPRQPLSVAEWRKLKESLGNPERFDLQMINALQTNEAELDIARSLLTFVATDTGTLSYRLLLRYLIMCVTSGNDTEVFDVYDIMRANYPTLDTGGSTLFIKSFSRTARWREAINILNELNKVFTPSARNYGHVISAAMQHGNLKTAWGLYDELIQKGLTPHEETLGSLFTEVRKTELGDGEEAETMSQSEHHERLLEILQYMRDNQIYPELHLTSRIKTWFESLTGQKWKGSWTNATPNGACGCCGSELESIQLTAGEYELLKDRVMTDIIEGQDIFKKTTPEEMETFKTFVKKSPVFDVVVDGLNVANLSNNKTKLSATLLAVVSELKRQGLTILVLGRKHMLRPSKSWDRQNMEAIRQKAYFFFTENISEDDPFLLYATLHSGNHCQFVSKDLMRDHKASLSDGATRRLFFKWQRGHQLVVAGSVELGKRVRFRHIPRYDTIVQSSADSWHFPYDDTDDRSSYEVPLRWLCLTKKN